MITRQFPLVKLFCITLLLLAWSDIQVKAQQYYNTETKDSLNVYQKAINEFSTYVGKYFPEVKEILVEESLITTTWLKQENEKVHVQVIPLAQVRAKLKKRKGEMYYTRIVPIRLDSNLFFINIIPFKVNRVNGQLEYINSGVFRTNFKYECELSQFLFVGIEGGLDNLR